MANNIKISTEITNAKLGSEQVYKIYLGANLVFQSSATIVYNIYTTIGNAVYTGKSFSVGGYETSPLDIRFKPDGTKMYVLGTTGDGIDEFSLSTAWDITTATYTTFKASGIPSPYAFHFKEDGTKVYIIDNGTVKFIRQYSLSVAWDISTMTYDSKLLNVATQNIVPMGLFIDSSGTRCFVKNQADYIHSYTLSTAWDITTGVYDGNTIGRFLLPFSNSQGFYFKSDGTKVVVLDTATGILYSYTLSTAWNVSTMVSDGKSLNISAQVSTSSSAGFFIDSTELKLFAITVASDTVYEYGF
jgi:DNA-binding beta-propeller fold protein YncE